MRFLGFMLGDPCMLVTIPIKYPSTRLGEMPPKNVDIEIHPAFLDYLSQNVFSTGLFSICQLQHMLLMMVGDNHQPKFRIQLGFYLTN